LSTSSTLTFLFASICQAVAEVVRTTLGPRAMLKMIIDPMGGIQMTNDGNAILREIDGSLIFRFDRKATFLAYCMSTLYFSIVCPQSLILLPRV
jgi:hypothetical protein